MNERCHRLELGAVGGSSLLLYLEQRENPPEVGGSCPGTSWALPLLSPN